MVPLRRALIVVLCAVIVAGALTGLMTVRSDTAPAGPALAGTLMNRPAPLFTLPDQSGRLISLRTLRGHPVVLTFLSAACTTLCPVVAESIGRAIREMGPAGKRVTVLAVSTAPEEDSRAATLRFLRAHQDLNWHYLSAPRRVLARVWREYYVYVAPANAPQSVKNDHTSATYFLDASGRERVLMAGAVSGSDVLRDLQILSGAPVAQTVGSRVAAPQVGHPAPSLALPTLSGGRLSLRSLHGRTLLLNFWASWCTACRTEMPLLVRWEHRLGGRLMVVGVDEQDSAGAARTFLARYGARYPVLFDGSNYGAAQYDIVGLPTSFLITPDGVVRFVYQGQLTNRDFVRQIVPALGG
ncbi:MAG TPA: redoxin domain-containing protein [Chloroflexota bacterium]|nr:redoxin domain-containing protein [Chloroflexota bacterium]